MKEINLYEYAVVRVVPRVEREEFINVGVLMYCRKQRYAALMFHLDKDRLKSLYKNIDISLIESHLISFQNICDGKKDAGKIAQLEQDERFRWLTANRSTIIQCSATHTGLSCDAQETHQELFNKLILQYW